MSYPSSMNIGAGVIVVALAAGVSILVANRGRQMQVIPGPQIVHTADWYVAHPDVLKADDARCGSDSASILQTACQNAATADQRLLAQQLQGAASTNAAAGKTSSPSTP